MIVDMHNGNMRHKYRMPQEWHQARCAEMEREMRRRDAQEALERKMVKYVPPKGWADRAERFMAVLMILAYPTVFILLPLYLLFR